MVPPPPRRHAEVRREPAQELPGHLQRELRLRGLARPLGGAAATSSPLWVDRGVRVFRVDNPHTKPLRVLGVADRRRPRATTRDVVFLAEAFTRRAMMTTLAKIGFSQSYTYFTWKNTKLGADRVRRPSWPTPAGDVLPPELLRQHARHPPRLPPGTAARRRSRRGSCWPRRSRPTYGIYSGFESFENVAGAARASEEYLDSEKYEMQERALDGPLLPLVAALNEIRRENPGAAAALQHHLPRDRERRPDRLREARAGATP